MADIASHPAGGRAELRAERHSGDRRDRRARAAAARDARAGEMPPASVTVIEEQVLRGPSRYSRQPMIRLLVDLGPLEAYPSNAIPGFVDALLDALPALVEHTCSYGRPGGFVRRLQEGTWLGHVVEHVALELQGVVGQRVTRGKTRSAGPVGRYNVLYTYRTEQVGLEAGRIAVSLVNRLIARPDEVQGVQLAADVERLRGLAERYGLGPSTQAIVDEAATRHIPVLPLGIGNLVQLGWGARGRRVRATLTDGTTTIASDIARDKEETSEILARVGLPVPRWRTVRTADDAAATVERLGVAVVKPDDGNHGRGVTLDVRDRETAVAAFAVAAAASRTGRVIVQEQIRGRDHRVLVVGGRMVACAERIPAGVTGDGRRSVTTLVEDANRDPRRGSGHGRALTRIRLNDDAARVLRRQGLQPSDVPAAGRWVALADTANLSTGGTAVDRTDEVHPSVRAVAEAAARHVGLDVVGIDIVTEDITRPLSDTGGAIVEVNAAPGFRMHTSPTEGEPRNVAAAVVDMLFPGHGEGRIPVAAITGTNGKTTTTRMLAAIGRAAGYRTGATTTDGITIDGWVMKAGDMAGPGSARVLLSDPAVELAVLEVARGGILREGLGYDWNDVAIVTNVGPDHLGLGGIRTVEQLAAVKGVIVEAVPRTGTAVLNADDRLVSAMASRCRGSLAWFSMQEPGGRGRECAQRTVSEGGLGGWVSGGRVVLWRGPELLVDVPVEDLPATFAGAARMNVANALAAGLGGLALGLSPAAVEAGLREFAPTLESAPGRLNVIEHRGRTVVVDYGHNVDAVTALASFLDAFAGERRRVGMLSIPGDRRPEDHRAVGRIAGRMLDVAFVADPTPRGRRVGETAETVAAAAREIATVAPNGSDGPARGSGEFSVVPDQGEAIDAAWHASRPGDVVVCVLTHAREIARILEQPDGR